MDLIDGHIKALEWTEKYQTGIWDVWNLGTGSGLSVRELVDITEKVIGKSLPTEVIAKRSVDLAIPISNPKKAEKELNWKATRTIEESIKNTYIFLSSIRKIEKNTEKKRVLQFLPYFPPHSG